jgi:hypothetical protein
MEWQGLWEWPPSQPSRPTWDDMGLSQVISTFRDFPAARAIAGAAAGHKRADHVP